jgi:hypothetical protein
VAHRQHQKFAQQSQPAPVAPAQPPAAAQQSSNVGSDLVVRLQLLADLKTSGALTEEEFTLAKAKLLHG